MRYFKCTEEKWGDSDVHVAHSPKVLADEMSDSFRRWADEEYHEDSDMYEDYDEWMRKRIDTMRAEFIDQLEEYVRCEYCCELIPKEIADEKVPDVDDDEAWDRLEDIHWFGCEWIVTRAHRLEP